ncbi:MAG: hypothetical protein R6V55_14290 [Desulfovermiculus sp.]
MASKHQNDNGASEGHAGITQKKIAEKAKVSPAAVSLIVAGKSKSKRIEDTIRTEVEKALAKGQEA